VIPALTAADSERLIAEGVATGGMQAKLNAATEAIRGGIGEVVIAPGATERAAARILAGDSIGTRLVPQEATHA
jgi:acetylglutamate kinase